MISSIFLRSYFIESYLLRTNKQTNKSETSKNINTHTHTHIGCVTNHNWCGEEEDEDKVLFS